MCCVAPTVNHAPKIPRGRAVRFMCTVGDAVQDGVLDEPTEWTLTCDAGGAFRVGHTCHISEGDIANSRQH